MHIIEWYSVMPMSIWVFSFCICTLMQYKYQELLLRFSLWLNILTSSSSLSSFELKYFFITHISCAPAIVSTHSTFEALCMYVYHRNLLLFQLHYWCYEIWSCELLKLANWNNWKHTVSNVGCTKRYIKFQTCCHTNVSGFLVFACISGFNYILELLFADDFSLHQNSLGFHRNGQFINYSLLTQFYD